MGRRGGGPLLCSSYSSQADYLMLRGASRVGKAVAGAGAAVVRTLLAEGLALSMLAGAVAVAVVGVEVAEWCWRALLLEAAVCCLLAEVVGVGGEFL